MTEQRRDPETERLPEDAARRLIQRATELDASISTQSSVAELREAARGAGISDEAFQRALDEVGQRPVSVPAAKPAQVQISRRSVRVLVALAVFGAILLAFATVVIPSRLVARPTTRAVEPVEAVEAAPVTPATPPAAPAPPAKRP